MQRGLGALRTSRVVWLTRACGNGRGAAVGFEQCGYVHFALPLELSRTVKGHLHVAAILRRQIARPTIRLNGLGKTTVVFKAGGSGHQERR